MTQDKELLFKDLCARMPYGVMCHIKGEKDAMPLHSCITDIYAFDFKLGENSYLTFRTVDEIKPYLFPLSSMTEEQYWEMQKLSGEDCLEHMEISKNFRNNTDFSNLPLYEYRVIDWLNRNHFDYRGLIPKGLALDATGLNIY